MKRMVPILFLILTLGLTGYGQSYFVQNQTNPRDGSSAVYMVNNYVTPQLELSAGIIRTPGGRDIYVLTSHYSGYDRLSVHTMNLVIDGEHVALERMIDSRRSRNSEIVAFEVTEDVFRKIGKAGRMKISLRGNWSIEKEMDEKNVIRFREFYATHMR